MPYKNLEDRRECQKRWRDRNPEAWQIHLDELRKTKTKTSPEWRKSHPDRYGRKQRNRALKSAYGITIDEYEAMHKAQNGLCAICQRPESRCWNKHGQSNHLAVDHDHITKKNRALLCGACNQAIGLLGEDILRLQAAIDYLKRHSQD